ncbi:MAG TPA: rhomboid family intramembrane serine protease [Caulobacteraceae bacterium]|nr:rhomboid family intramembrane serine protease [Caulobacteraceae bacterium]
MDGPWGAPRRREPLFNAPWPVMATVAALLAAFLLELWVGDHLISAYGFSPAALAAGHWDVLVTALFLHGGWAHLLINSGFILAFGAPVARRMGEGASGALAFFVFFLVCGVLGNLAYAALHPGGTEPLIGASGAGSGLMAGASRLMTQERKLASFFSRPVVMLGGAFIGINLIVAVFGWAPGAGDAKVAWEAHLGGYLAGLLLLAPTLALLRRL